MCLAMNADQAGPGERCASTSNRNFEGRQGNGRPHPPGQPGDGRRRRDAGHFVDVRRSPEDHEHTMQAFTVHKGLVAPMDRANVDTDAIIPKQFLKSIKRSGFGPTCSTSGATWTRASPARTTARASPTPTSC
jgi:hypothetical protein